MFPLIFANNCRCKIFYDLFLQGWGWGMAPLALPWVSYWSPPPSFLVMTLFYYSSFTLCFSFLEGIYFYFSHDYYVGLSWNDWDHASISCLKLIGPVSVTYGSIFWTNGIKRINLAKISNSYKPVILINQFFNIECCRFSASHIYCCLVLCIVTVTQKFECQKCKYRVNFPVKKVF